MPSPGAKPGASMISMPPLRDHMMSAATKHAGRKPAVKPISPDEPTLHVDEYLASKITASAAEKIKDAAKKWLFEWLGADNCKALPDGRLVTRKVTPIAPEKEPRKGFDKKELVIVGPPVV